MLTRAAVAFGQGVLGIGDEAGITGLQATEEALLLIHFRLRQVERAAGGREGRGG